MVNPNRNQLCVREFSGGGLHSKIMIRLYVIGNTDGQGAIWFRYLLGRISFRIVSGDFCSCRLK